MALSRFIHHWFILFLPYQNLSHFRTLLDFFADLTLYRSVTAQRKVYLVYIILAMFFFQNLYLWLFLPPPMDRLRRSDPVSLVFQIDTFYLVMLTLALMTIYFIEVLCFTMKPAFLRLLEDTLFQDRTGALQGVGYGTVSGQATSRFIFLGIVNLLQVFFIFIETVLLFVIYSLFTTAMKNPGELFGSPLHTPFTFIWNVIQMILGTWITVTSLALYGKVNTTVGGLGVGYLCIVFRRLYHSESILSIYKQRESIFSWAPLRHYLTYSGQTFQIIFTANDIYGRAYLAFLVVSMPISAWAIVQIACGEQSQWSSIALAFVPSHELLICILFHWAVAKFTKRLHAPSKALLRLNAATGHRMGNFRARLLLHHTIIRLHTKDKYGITYGSVGGLVTMGSFGKCMLLYIELLMYAYKYIRDI